MSEYLQQRSDYDAALAPKAARKAEPSQYGAPIDAAFIKSLKRMLNAYGYAGSKHDLALGYEKPTHDVFRTVYGQLSYNTQYKKNYEYGNAGYDPWAFKDSPDINEAYASYFKQTGRTPANEDEWNAFYYPNYKYKGQYGNSLEDIRAQQEGKKPWKYQVTDAIAEKIKALGPNPTPEQLQELVQSDPYMRDLQAAADARRLEQEEAQAEGKGGWSFQGTSTDKLKDIDVAGLAQLGYDPIKGWQPLLERVTKQSILQAQQNIYDRALRAQENAIRAAEKAGIPIQTRPLAPLSRQEQMMQRQYGEELTEEAEKLEHDFNVAYDKALTERYKEMRKEQRERRALVPGPGNDRVENLINEGATLAEIEESLAGVANPMYPRILRRPNGGKIYEFDKWEQRLHLNEKEARELREKVLRDLLGIGPDEVRPYFFPVDKMDIYDWDFSFDSEPLQFGIYKMLKKDELSDEDKEREKKYWRN